jgi:TPR repeat protein
LVQIMFESELKQRHSSKQRISWKKKNNQIKSLTSENDYIREIKLFNLRQKFRSVTESFIFLKKMCGTVC